MRPDDLLLRANPWWTNGVVPPDLLKPFRRNLFQDLIRFLADRQVLVIRGLRRTGKTTLLFQLVGHLIDQGVAPRHLIYYSFDELTWKLDSLVSYVEETVLQGPLREVGRVYFLLDEVQRLDEWALQVKQFYDLYPNVKFVVSGSASLGIERAAQESLAGRSYYFDLGPLSFREYLALAHEIEPDGDVRLWQRELAPLVIRYLARGLPEIVAEEDEERIRRYIWEGVTERVLYRDLPAQYDVRDPELLKDLLLRTLDRPGWYVNFDSVSRELRRDRRTLARYLGYLEYAYLVRTVANYRGSLAASSRKLKRAYPIHPCLAIAVYGQTLERLPLLVEAGVRSHFEAQHYWRADHQEVDFVVPRDGKTIAVEVKFVRQPLTPRDLRGLRTFLRRFPQSQGLVVTRDQWEDWQLEEGAVRLRPFWAVLLEQP